MYKRWVGVLVFVLLCMSISARVSAQEISTFFQQSGGHIFLFVDHDQVNVVFEPFLGVYDPYDFDQMQQLDDQWIIPLPAPAIEEDDTLFYPPDSYPLLREELAQIDQLTQVRFEPEAPRYCYNTFEYMGRSSDHSFPVEVMAQVIGYAAVPNADFDTVLNRLQAQGFAVAGDRVAQLRQYAEAGLSFLAVKYHLDIQADPAANQYTIYGAPFVFAFKWSAETIPLTFSSALYRNLTTWIFSDQAYHSANIPSSFPDYSQFRAPHSIMNTGIQVDNRTDYYSGLVDAEYQETLEQILTGGGLVTEYAGSTAILADLDDIKILSPVIKDYPYVSRFVVRTSDSTTYPIYEPVPNQPPISNVIDLSASVDPLAYWGCSSRTALDETTRANLPEGRRRFDDLRFTVAYPPDWQFSTVTSATGTIYGFSPEPLTLDRISAALRGDASQPPMFIFSEHINITDGYAGPVLTKQNLLTQLNLETTRYPWPQNFMVRFDLHQKEKQQEHGVMYGLLANETDWAENGALYQAMLAYVQSYQYFASADWPNTLFIQSHPLAETEITLEIPYPDGWIEHMADDNIVVTDGTAELRLIPDATATSAGLQSRYHLTGKLACGQLAPFQANGREGYVLLTTGYFAEVSTPEGKIAEYEPVLLKMLTALSGTCTP
ncbi:MAG TPA: hypothetical protein VHO69_15495 [Phototrophicaceae bacterium]|nr:hypothetical protein [Phototrophicaceae bacterium]